jgi:ABC-type bacteriocin/lantibiotic exporter with double-glycine peptidase domain
VAAALALGGCGTLGEATPFDPEEFRSEPGWLVVSDVPVSLQRRSTDCGTAALSMVLAYWQVPLDDTDLSASGLLVPGKGARAKDLRDFARRKGLESFLIHGEWEDLLKEISRGHPVIVGLVKPADSGAVTHYEVVVAVHPDRGIVVTHDPAAGWQQNSRSGFRKEWDPAGYLTLVFYRADGDSSPSDTSP